jgi:preprotein translocase subunit YajC
MGNMDLIRFGILFGQAPVTVDDPRAQTLKSMGMMVGLVVIFYMIMIRPQQKKAKQHQELLKAVKPGDKVITSGGILGVVITVKEKTVTIRSADTKLEITKSAIAEITERSGGESKES